MGARVSADRYPFHGCKIGYILIFSPMEAKVLLKTVQFAYSRRIFLYSQYLPENNVWPIIKFSYSIPHSEMANRCRVVN
jgi:hypothetical protein